LGDSLLSHGEETRRLNSLQNMQKDLRQCRHLFVILINPCRYFDYFLRRSVDAFTASDTAESRIRKIAYFCLHANADISLGEGKNVQFSAVFLSRLGERTVAAGNFNITTGRGIWPYFFT